MTVAALDPAMVTVAENYIVARIRAKNIFIYPVSDQFSMKERIRGAILDNKIDFVILGKNSATKHCETFAEAFERVYAEPLDPTTTKRKGKSNVQR